MLLMIDNLDSFTYNIVQYFLELEQEVITLRSDQVTMDDIQRLQPEYLVISPGPGKPAQATLSKKSIEYFANKCPILGVCLGHQCIAEVFGGRVTHARQIKHGKCSAILHTGDGLFNGCPCPMQVTRYHSLIVEERSLTSELLPTAWTEDELGTGQRELMAFQHQSLPIFGVQFHPESILSEAGHSLLQNFLHSTPPASYGRV